MGHFKPDRTKTVSVKCVKCQQFFSASDWYVKKYGLEKQTCQKCRDFGKARKKITTTNLSTAKDRERAYWKTPNMAPGTPQPQPRPFSGSSTYDYNRAGD